tara:strand:+ start:129 stop:665 length:537 start_codon:yes stop_codon:yes gene_type:complete
MDIKIGSKVTLTKDELEECKEVAFTRHGVMMSVDSTLNNLAIDKEPSKQITVDHPLTLEELSVRGQTAFCILAGSEPDRSVHPRSSQNNTEKPHTILPNGLSVTIRVTRKKTNRLVVEPHKKQVGDLYALMIGDGDTYEFRGFKKQKELLQDKYLKNIGWGLLYAADQCELVDLKDLK